MINLRVNNGPLTKTASGIPHGRELAKDHLSLKFSRFDRPGCQAMALLLLLINLALLFCNNWNILDLSSCGQQMQMNGMLK
jgi:hypothetical protein